MEGWARFDRAPEPPRPLDPRLLLGGILVFVGYLFIALLPLAAAVSGAAELGIYILGYLLVGIGFLYALYGIAARLAG